MSDQASPQNGAPHEGAGDDGVWPNDVLPRGTVLNGYRITALLGRGGFGVTYLAEDVIGQSFALKEYFPRQFALRHGAQVRPTSGEDAQVFDDCRSRFVYEARALVALGRARQGHSEIVRVQTFFEANGTAYMVMEYIVGRTLQAALREHPGGMPEADMRRILGGILSGLAAVHEAGMMHRDIKPANVLLRDGVSPVLIDFGSSREAGGQQTQGFTQIFSGGYAPPEQIMGTRQGPFSDIYAVGVVAYQAIGGKVADAITRQHAASTRAPDPMPPARELGAGRYDEGLLLVIDAALALDPADRPASASAMAEMLLQPPGKRQAPAPAPPTPSGPMAESELLPPQSVPGPAPADPAGPRRIWPWLVGAGAVAALALVWLGLKVWPGWEVGPAPLASVAPSLAPGQVPQAVPNPIQVPAPPPAPVVVPVPPPVSVPPPTPSQIATPAPPPIPSLPPVPASEMEALRAAASTVPCALLSISSGDGGAVVVSGHARPGPQLDEFLRQARGVGRSLQATVDPVAPGLCPPLPIVADALRQERERDTLAIVVGEGGIAIGGRLAATVQGRGGGTLQVDLLTADGMVHHIMRRPLPSGQWNIQLQATVPAPVGQQMLIAIATSSPLDLASRPSREQMSEYLPALQRELDRAAQSGANPPRAEVVFFQAIRAASAATPTASPAVTPSLSPSRCMDIVARVQLGETLSDAERTLLRTQCRP